MVRWEAEKKEPNRTEKERNLCNFTFSWSDLLFSPNLYCKGCFCNAKLSENTFICNLLNLLSVPLSFAEVEVQQQRLQEGSRGSSFCGPDTEKHTNLDCISVPYQKIHDLHNDGRKKCYKNQSSSSTCTYSNRLFRLIYAGAELLHRKKTKKECSGQYTNDRLVNV